MRYMFHIVLKPRLGDPIVRLGVFDDFCTCMADKIVVYSNHFNYQILRIFGKMNFELHSDYKPTGDQPQAIKELVEGFRQGNQFQTLLGVTGSGKTFTMANVIAALNKPTLIISHNKTLAGQLYSEMKEYFPGNAVEYFVSCYVHNSTPQYLVA